VEEVNEWGIGDKDLVTRNEDPDHRSMQRWEPFFTSCHQSCIVMSPVLETGTKPKESSVRQSADRHRKFFY